MRKKTKVIVALLSGSLLVGCAQFQPSTQAGAADGPALSACERNAMIEDFEAASNQIIQREGRGGYIYPYADELGSTIEFPSRPFRVYPGGVGSSQFVARFRGTTASGGGDVFAGLGFDLAPEGASPTYDASKYTGISFLAKRGSKDSLNVIRFNVADANSDPKGSVCTECFNHFGTPVKLEDEWTRYVVFFDELEQSAGWGSPRPANIDSSALIGLSWQVAAPNAKFDFMIDEIAFIGACGESYAKRAEPTPEPAPEPQPEPEPTPEPAPEPQPEPEPISESEPAVEEAKIAEDDADKKEAKAKVKDKDTDKKEAKAKASKPE
jgi:hypothetical protein